MDARRAFDLAVAIPAFVLALPIIVVVGLAVFITSGLPVFLIQQRVGARERPILVVKFRTMRRGVPVVAKSLLTPSEELYTRLGRTLRRSSLDELPQLWNVLRGDMSVIGPRPALPSQHDLLTLRRRHGITDEKPGITGLAQVLGRESLTLSTKVRSEALYQRRRGLRLDLVILAWTIRALLDRRGAL